MCKLLSALLLGATIALMTGSVWTGVLVFLGVYFGLDLILGDNRGRERRGRKGGREGETHFEGISSGCPISEEEEGISSGCPISEEGGGGGEGGGGEGGGGEG